MGRKFLTTPTLPTLPSAPSSPSVGNMYFDTTLGKIGVYTSSGWVYNLYQIEDGSITTSKIANGAVTTPKIADESITYAKLAQDVRDAIGSSGGGGGARIFQTTIGDGTSSSYTVTHNFNTTNVEVSLILLSTNEKIGAKVVVLNANQIQVSFISPIAANSVKVIVIG
jgi:hypothetical protein